MVTHAKAGPGILRTAKAVARGRLNSVWPRAACLVLLWCAAVAGPVEAKQTTVPAVVQAVLFVSPTCHFCQQIVDQELPPAIQKYGSQLQILRVDVTTPAGDKLYSAALDTLHVPGGVPIIFVGDTVLGGVNIPTQLPGVVDKYLAQGGIGWPAIPGLDAYLAGTPYAGTVLPTAPATATRPATPEAGQSLPTGTATPAAPPATPAPQTTEQTLAAGMCQPFSPCVGPTATPKAASAGLSTWLPRGPNGLAVAVGVTLGILIALAIAGIAIFRTLRQTLQSRRSKDQAPAGPRKTGPE